jgi:protein TonB
MFADSLLESPWSDRSRRGWTTAVSFAMQAVGLSILLVLPLLYTDALPKLQLLQTIAPPAPPPGPPPAIEHHGSSGIHESNLFQGLVVAPPTIPSHVAQVEDESGPEAPACMVCVPGGTGSYNPANPVLNGLGNGRGFAPPPPPKPSAPPPRISRMMEGNLIYRPQPAYPAIARTARVQGAVILRAIISREGTIENLQVVSGPPLLVGAAIEAVRQWRYRPYLLNGEPVEVETQVTVNFVLSGG